MLPVLVHGDAAFAGQGVVAETLNLSQLPGYRVGGTIHLVINNQVGFTTAAERRPVVAVRHRRGQDGAGADLPRERRRPRGLRAGGPAGLRLPGQRFHKDVVIDMVCYRRHGHNEGDEPSYTQPLMYALIDARRSVRKLYTEALVNRGDITLEEAEAGAGRLPARLEGAFAETQASGRRRRTP